MALGHRILVPLDGSGFAERALPLATAVARHVDGEIHVLTVTVPWPDTGPGVAGLVAEAEREAADWAAAYVGEVAAPLREAGLRVRTHNRRGAAAAGILGVVEELGCDLLVMATHGRSGFNRLWMGSVADRVVRHAPIPVLLVSAAGGAIPEKEGADVAGAAVELDDAPRDVRTVIIPLDGSAFSESVLVPATALGDAFGAEYILFRAVPYPRAWGMPLLGRSVQLDQRILDVERAAARRQTEAVAGRLREAGYNVTVVVEEKDDPAPTVLRLAAATRDSVIALATHGRSGLGRVLIGSVADKIVRGTRRPVLLVRPTK